jgi:hypothetical protein
LNVNQPNKVLNPHKPVATIQAVKKRVYFAG